MITKYHIAKYPYYLWHICLKQRCLYKMFKSNEISNEISRNEIEKKNNPVIVLFFEFEVVMLLKASISMQ